MDVPKEVQGGGDPSTVKKVLAQLGRLGRIILEVIIDVLVTISRERLERNADMHRRYLIFFRYAFLFALLKIMSNVPQGS